MSKYADEELTDEEERWFSKFKKRYLVPKVVNYGSMLGGQGFLIFYVLFIVLILLSIDLFIEYTAENSKSIKDGARNPSNIAIRILLQYVVGIFLLLGLVYYYEVRNKHSYKKIGALMIVLYGVVALVAISSSAWQRADTNRIAKKLEEGEQTRKDNEKERDKKEEEIDKLKIEIEEKEALFEDVSADKKKLKKLKEEVKELKEKIDAPILTDYEDSKLSFSEPARISETVITAVIILFIGLMIVSAAGFTYAGEAYGL